MSLKISLSLSLAIIGILSGCASPEQPPSPVSGSTTSRSREKKYPYVGISVTEKSICDFHMHNDDVGYSMIELALDHHMAAVTLNAGEGLHADPLYFWRLKKDEVVIYETEDGTHEKFRFKFLKLTPSGATIVFPSGQTTTYRIHR